MASEFSEADLQEIAREQAASPDTNWDELARRSTLLVAEEPIVGKPLHAASDGRVLGVVKNFETGVVSDDTDRRPQYKVTFEDGTTYPDVQVPLPDQDVSDADHPAM